ncbi:hypothetical protein [Alicycliphilus denitrificans]|uniref:hypothetical protein n=1 Tax=Alicycliphilus denitrificans TaxID=179636 RepID=UPI00384DD0D5
MTDAELIEKHGGPSKLAKKMALTEKWAVQRIHNWKKRGIPARVKLAYADLFLSAEAIGNKLDVDVVKSEA